MKVKIGDKIYDASEEPILLILTQEDKKNIENMTPDTTKYCAFPDNTSLEFVKEFMKVEN
jgi:hypothetical protein